MNSAILNLSTISLPSEYTHIHTLHTLIFYLFRNIYVNNKSTYNNSTEVSIIILEP